MQFIYQPLTWGFFLVLVPLLIHLINLMRHRRVQWAAMDFLLQSYRKHRTWVWLKQFLLLLLRMLAIAAIVAMLAQLVTQDQWASFFGGKTVHHIVLLDDSFSMSDRVGGTSAFERASQALGQTFRRSGGQETAGLQKFTLLRFSRASRAADPAHGPLGLANSQDDSAASLEVLDLIADLSGVIVDANFELVLEEKRRGFDVTELAVGPVAALGLTEQLVKQSPDEQAVVYVVSDFRVDPWDTPEETRLALQRLERAGAQLHLIRCVQTNRSNLAITKIEPASGTRAAGVPLFVEITVKNFGPDRFEQVQLSVRTTYFPGATPATDPASLQGKRDELPTVLIDRIDPGQSVTRRVQVYFPMAGQHVVEAELPDDAVAVDNRRSCVVDFPNEVPVLVIDGDPNQRHAYFLQSVFQPGQRAKTGIRPSLERPSFLRDVTPEGLRAFRAVYLLDVDRLDERAVENLQTYVHAGGGLALFLGPNVNTSFYNRWYGDGTGLFPVALDRQELLGPNLDGSPDLIVTDHPLFRVFLGQSNPFLQGIHVDQYIEARPDWDPPEDSTIRVLAQLRNRQPLVVARSFGDGQVVAFLTTLAPDWNNWARQPSIIVVLLELHNYLDARRTESNQRMVGTPIDLALSVQEYRPDMRFVVPGNRPGVRRVVGRTAFSPHEEDSPVMTVSLGRHAAAGETDRGGVYEVWPVRLDGQQEVRRYALNVDTRESDLAVVEPTQLASKLDPIKVEIHEPDEISYAAALPSGFPWSQLILFGLIGLLLGEQMLAYSASYHPARGVKQ